MAAHKSALEARWYYIKEKLLNNAMRAIFAGMFFILTISASAQQWQNGLILPDRSKVKLDQLCCIYLPKEGFRVYGSPGGALVGKLKTEEVYDLVFIHSGKKREIDRSELIEIGYEIWVMPYCEKREGYVRVISSKYDYWLKESEIAGAGFLTGSWQEFLILWEKETMGFYAKDPGLKLRKGPSVNDEVIIILRGNLYEIAPGSEVKGAWMKVKVKKYREHPCESDLPQEKIVEYETEGWVKIVDDSGLPNVTYYPRGC
jgi:hypothetical protein